MAIKLNNRCDVISVDEHVFFLLFISMFHEYDSFSHKQTCILHNVHFRKASPQSPLLLIYCDRIVDVKTEPVRINLEICVGNVVTQKKSVEIESDRSTG